MRLKNNLALFAGLYLASLWCASSIGVAQTNPVPAVAPAAETSRVYTIGVVEDGPCEATDHLIEGIRKELAALMENRKIVFKRAPEFNAGWDRQRLNEPLTQALQDPAVDLVLVAGLLTFREVSRRGVPLGKPVIGAIIEEPNVTELPRDAAFWRSGQTNCFVLVVLVNYTRDLKVLYELVPFKHLAVLADAVMLQGRPDFKPQIEQVAQSLGAQVELVPMDQSAGDVLAKLDATWDAVYLTPALRMRAAEWQTLIDGLNARKLPVFSMIGHADVARGVLAGTSPDNRSRLARKLALIIRQMLAGETGHEFGAVLTGESKLLLNAKTAIAIGYSPRLETLMSVDLLYADALHSGHPLSLAKAVNIAMEQNVTLDIKRSEVEISRQDRNRAMSTLLPQVNGSLAYNQVGRDQSEDSFGMLPEKQTKLGLNVSQVIFNDPAISRFRSGRRYYQGMQSDQENNRLDVVELASKSYIRYLHAQALLRIQADNLNLTHNNLDLARLRHKLGAAGSEEVFRWETQAASQQANLIKACANVDMLRVAMNQTLGVAINTHWQTEDIVIRTNDFHFLGDRLTPLLQTENNVLAFEDFVVGWGLTCSPALAALDKQIEAQQILLAQAQRRFLLPEFGAGFEIGRALQESLPALPDGLGLTESDNRNTWLFGIQATLPFLEGGGMFFDVSKAKAQLNQLCFTRGNLARQLDQRTRIACYALAASYANIRLQRQAANFAARNLEIVKDKYARGALSMLDLLDAQNQMFVANQNATMAAYTYLEDLIELQRAMSWFEAEKTEQEQDDWANRLAAFIKMRREGKP